MDTTRNYTSFDKIAIIGHPRSGSTWLAQMFAEEFRFPENVESYTTGMKFKFAEFEYPNFNLPASEAALTYCRNDNVSKLSTKEVYFYNKIPMLQDLGYSKIFCLVRDMQHTIFDVNGSYKAIAYAQVILNALLASPDFLDDEIKEILNDLPQITLENRLRVCVIALLVLRVILYRNCQKYNVPVVNYSLFYKDDKNILEFLERYSESPDAILIKIKETRFDILNLKMRQALYYKNGIHEIVQNFADRYKSLIFGNSTNSTY